MVRPTTTLKTQSYRAPAKTNLNLRVLGKREDGFHEISTRMVALSLADDLQIRRQPGGGIRFTCSDPTLPTDEGNLVIKATRAFEELASKRIDVHIHLEKRIPVGAGLGGGSSNAASMLLALQHLTDSPLSSEELRNLAASLGSDVPFFLEQHCACDCSGRGETVEPVAFDWKLPIILLKPEFPVSAGWAYQHWAESKEIPGVSYRAQACPWGSMVNDLERPVFEKHLILAEMKTWLLAQPEIHTAIMSGSGSTMLGVVTHVHRGFHLAERARKHFGESLWTFVGYTI